VKFIIVALALLACARATVEAQSPARVPWLAGEDLEYSVKLEGIPAVTALLQPSIKTKGIFQKAATRRSG
jgi:hypothetical protein